MRVRSLVFVFAALMLVPRGARDSMMWWAEIFRVWRSGATRPGVTKTGEWGGRF